MKQETLVALQESIAKWERNAVAETSDDVKVMSDACPLCKLFLSNHSCAGCPVSDRAGFDECMKTPWRDASRRLGYWISYDTEENRANFRAAARAEVDFLKSLLPSDAA